MNIHIRGTVEFEKILSEPWRHAIETTRARMAVQQLLDTQESPTHLETQLQNYIVKMDSMLHHMSQHHTQPLIEQPLFEWSIGDTIIQTPCWRIETILPRFALGMVKDRAVHESISSEQFKQARALCLSQEKLHIVCASKIAQWKWKLPHLNHDVLKVQWHVAKADIYRGMADLCMLSTGIQKNTASTALFTVAQRGLRHFARAVTSWPSDQAKDLMNVAESLRYYYSSDILWSKGSYGQSIDRLERWHHAKLEFGPFSVLKSELGKIPFLCRERRQTNDGAYFDTIKPATKLADVSELIHTKESTDIPHPVETPSWDVGDAGELSPPELSETQ